MDKENVLKGLSDDEVNISRKNFGSNSLEMQDDRVLLIVLKEVVLEPTIVGAISRTIGKFFKPTSASSGGKSNRRRKRVKRKTAKRSKKSRRR